MKQHQKRVQFSRSVHRLQYTANNKITFITRTQKLVSPIIQSNTQSNISARSTQRTPTPIRRVINTLHIKTLSDMTESQEMKGSLFKFVQSNEFQTLKQEEKQKTNSEIQFTLEGLMIRKDKTMRKSIFHNQYNTQCKFNEENNLNTKAFIKKILQLILGTQRNDINLNNDSVFSDKEKYKTQLSSPRITFTNHLSTIPLMNQQTQLKTMGTGIYQIMDNVVVNIERPIPIPIPLPKMKIQLTICNPEQQQIKQEFTIPEYCVQTQEILSPLINHQNELIEQYSDKPQHVLKQALTFLAQQKKSTQSKFSKSILKIVGIKEDNHEESQTFNSLKTRRFCKLYMQNKIQRTFSKLEEHILLSLQLLGDSNSAIFIKTQDSPSTSRILSSQTNHIGNLNFNFENGTQQPTIYNEQSIISYRINLPLIDKLFNKFIINLDENITDDLIYNVELDERIQQVKQPIQMIECPGLYEILNRNYLNFIISNLDDNSRNILLSDSSLFRDQTMLLQTLDSMQMSQCHNVINYKLSRLSRLDKIQIAYKIYGKYNEILTGIFEDTHEINNMHQEYQFLEFEEPIKHKQTFNNIFTKAIAPAMRIIHKNQQTKNAADQSPRSKQKYANNSPRTTNQMVQSTGQRVITKKPSLLDAQSTQLSRKQTDSPQQSIQQEELSIKTGKEESSNANTTQSNNNTKKKTINNPIGSQTNIPHKDNTINNDRRERRNAALAYSMTKHSLQMRTHIAEAERRRVQPLNDIIRLLIEEQKLNELVEIFGNNPNIMINERSQDTNTYLITAAQTGCVEIVQLLLFRGAGVNLQNAEGDTALHRAIAFNFYNVADLLIQNGATIIKNNKGLTPWQLAQK